MGPIAQTLLLCGFSAATLLACLLLFLSLKRENAQMRRRAQADRDTFQQTLTSYRTSLERLEAALADRDMPSPPAAAVPMESMNINKRSQVLRLFRRGETPDRIAASLRLPRSEVDLLLKVHRTVISQL